MTTQSHELADIKALADDGLIDLDTVFADAEWVRLDILGEYEIDGGGDEPWPVYVWLETTIAYGIRAWRWKEAHDCGPFEDAGPITLSRDDVADAAIERINERYDAMN